MHYTPHQGSYFAHRITLEGLGEDALGAVADDGARRPQPASSGRRAGDSRRRTPLNCLTNAARLDGFSDFIKSKTGVEHQP